MSSSFNPYIAHSLANVFKHRDSPKGAADVKKEEEPLPKAPAAAAGAGELAPVVAAMKGLTLAPQLDTLPEQLASISAALVQYEPTLELLGAYLDHLQAHLSLPNSQDVRALLFRNNAALIAQLFKGAENSFAWHGDFLSIPPKMQAALLLPGAGDSITELHLETGINRFDLFCETFPNLVRLRAKNGMQFAVLAKLQALEQLEAYSIGRNCGKGVCPKLTALTLIECEDLIQAIGALRENCPALTSLHLHKANFGAQAAPAGTALPKVTHLEIGSGFSGRSPNATGAKIAQFFPALTHLTHNRMSEIETWDLLPHLVSFKAEGSVGGLQAFVAKNPQLQRLDFTGHQERLESILEAIKPASQLTHLTLETYRLQDFTKELAEALKKNHPMLQEITLKMPLGYISEPVVEALKVLPKVTILQSYPGPEAEQKRLAAALPHAVFKVASQPVLPQKSADDHYKALHKEGANPFETILKGRANLLHDLVMKSHEHSAPLPLFLQSAVQGAGRTLRALKFDRYDFDDKRFGDVAALVPEVQELHAHLMSRRRLADIARGFSKLEKLRVVGIGSVSHMLEEDFSVVSGLQHLRGVVLDGTYMVARSVITSLVKAQPALTSFTMGYIICNSMLADIATLKELKELSVHLDGLSLTPKAFFTAVGTHFTKLERLAVACPVTKETVVLLAPLQALTSLEVEITDPEVIQALGAQHPRLSEMRLGGNVSAALTAALAHIKALRKLTVGDSASLAGLAAACPKLEELVFEREYVLTTEEAEVLLQFPVLKEVRGIRIFDYLGGATEEESRALKKSADLRRLALITNLEKKGCRIYEK